MVFVRYSLFLHKGMLPMELHLLFGHLFSEDDLTLQSLNHCIASFELGYMEEKDRPSAIEATPLSEGRLGQTGEYRK